LIQIAICIMLHTMHGCVIHIKLRWQRAFFLLNLPSRSHHTQFSTTAWLELLLKCRNSKMLACSLTYEMLLFFNLIVNFVEIILLLQCFGLLLQNCDTFSNLQSQLCFIFIFSTWHCVSSRLHKGKWSSYIYCRKTWVNMYLQI